MIMYVGVTDQDWFEMLRAGSYSEVNFWKPGSGNFRAINEGDLFLFKLHSPYNFIVGGGFFERFSVLPTFLVWDTFGRANGVHSLDELHARILKYRKKNNTLERSPQIGCVLLNNVFYFHDKDWIPVPEDWKSNIVQGRRYNTDEPYGARLYQQVIERLQDTNAFPADTEETTPDAPADPDDPSVDPGSSDSELILPNRFKAYLTKHRLGQGAFRVGITEAYQRQCAVSGERTLPVLEAAHIQSVQSNGPYSINNGILLRSDIHKLYDTGYITIDSDYRIDVSHHLHEDFGNGKIYYQYQGKKIHLPADKKDYPSQIYLEWHNNNVFVG